MDKQRCANGQMGTINMTESQAIFKDRVLDQTNAFWSNFTTP
jgi:hypothetical protein